MKITTKNEHYHPLTNEISGGGGVGKNFLEYFS